MFNKSIIVSGGCGFIGSNFIKNIINLNYNIIIIDNLSRGNIKNYKILKKKNNIFFFKIDLTKKKYVEIIFKKFKVEYIFHFAALVNVEESIKYPKKFLHNNINSTENLLYFTKKYNVKYFIFSSSAAVYGNLDKKTNISENSKIKPINPYGYSKVICEKKILKNFKKSNFKYCIFRYFNVFGKNLTKTNLNQKNLNILDKISFYSKKNKIFYVHGKNHNTKDGTPIRDFISVQDIVNAHKECFKKNKNFWNKIYNVGYNKGISVLNIINIFNKNFKKKLKFEYNNNKKGIISYSVANNKKIKKLSNWKPKNFNVALAIKKYFLS